MIRHSELDLIVQATPREMLADAKNPVNEVLRPDFPAERGRVVVLLGRIFGLWHPTDRNVRIKTLCPDKLDVEETIYREELKTPQSYSLMITLARKGVVSNA